MGTAMARALHRAGMPLVLYNRTPARAEALAAELGASVEATPAAVARAAGVCVSMVADAAAVDDLFRGPDGLLAGARPENVFVDCSTVLPETIRSLEADVRAAGAGLLDAPVSGSTSLAEAGELTLMVGGDAADLERARPVLDAIGKRVFHVGPLGTGAAMKLAVNAVIFGLNGALAEGLVLAERAGIDRGLAHEVIATGATGAPYVSYKRAAFLEPETTPVAFALDLAAKDLQLILALGREVGVHLTQAATNLEMIRLASVGGRGGEDFSRVTRAVEATAGDGTGGGADGT
jgi:3-hydroxyisobutyrate dehydrogenase/2-hydroxy-3-oxopropionate reductase